MKNSKVLVTGGLGFVGSFLSKRLVDLGYSVRVFDNSSRGSLEKISGYEKDLEIIEGDMRDAQSVAEAVKGVEIVYHLGAVNGTRFFYEEPEKVLEVNVKGVINTLEASMKAGVRRFIFSSSSEIYNEPEHIPTPETERAMIPDITNPRFSYAGSKLIGELFCMNYARKSAIEPVIIRYHNIYGPHMAYDHVIPEIFLKIKKASDDFQKKQVEIELQGTGEETRAFCYVDDAVEGTIIASQKAAKSDIVHIGTDKEIKIKDLVSQIGNVLGVRVNTKITALRAGSTPRRCPDISKLKKMGYQPKIDLNEGLKRTLEWYKQNTKLQVA